MRPFEPLFSDGFASDQAYCNLRDPNSSEFANEARVFAEKLWAIYHRFADRNFLEELRRNFHSRFWEMYLTCALLDSKQHHCHHVSCRKPGPDVLLSLNGHQLWVEAVTASDGDPTKPDSLVAPPTGVSHRIPDERVILRYSTALNEKFLKFVSYRQKGTIDEKDICIVALNGSNLIFSWADGEIPRILKAVFPIGLLQASLDSTSGEIESTSYQFRPAISKSNRSLVSTTLFANSTNSHISAIIYSNANVLSFNLGADFVLIHNPYAANKIERGLLPSRREYWAEPNGEYMRLFCNSSK